MLQALIACALVHAGPQPVMELRTRAVAASIFKPGLVLVVREGNPTTAGRYRLDVVPDAIDGTFWPEASDGAQIGDVKTSLKTGRKSVKVLATGFADYLAANVGKRMSLRVSRGQDQPELVQGILEHMGPPPNGVASIRLANGNLRVIAPTSIVEMATKGLAREYLRTVPYPQIEVVLDVEKPGRVRFMTLESGAAWTGSYLVDLVGNKARLTGKAQVAVGSLHLEDTNVQVLSGLPTLENTGRHDLASGIGSLRDYLSGSQST